VTLLELDKYELSKEAFDKAVALEPTNYDRIIDIYKAFYKYGYPSLGMEYVQNAMDNQSSMSDYDKGRMFYHIGNYSQAVIALEKVDKKKNPDASLYLGMSYEVMGDYNYAASVYNSGMANSTNPALYNQLGLCQLKRGAYEEALAAFQAGLKCEDTSLHQSLRFNEAIAYEYLADFDTAKKLMAAYLKDYPNDETAKREYEFLKTR
jgi:tetratricopeptide (TPR) repeat protein